jgi:hypothetical protein
MLGEHHRKTDYGCEQTGWGRIFGRKIVNPIKASLTNPGNFSGHQGSKVDPPPPEDGTVSWELGFMALAWLEFFPKRLGPSISPRFHIAFAFTPWVPPSLPVAY